MILILTNSILDDTAEEVMDWLFKLGIGAVRINGEDFFKNPRKYFKDYSDIKAVWYRSWYNPDVLDDRVKSDCVENIIDLHINLREDRKVLTEFFFDFLKNKPWLSSPNHSHVNKLRVLKKAKKLGLKVPNFIFTGEKSLLFEFLEKEKEIITKGIGGNQFFNCSPLFTSEINLFEINKLDKNFTPSFFQKKITKKFEIRTFVLDEKFYSMAIFSQADNKTAVDYRKYNGERPNRTVPYKLENPIKSLILDLMSDIGTRTASFDFIFGIDRTVYFLEMNPIGQFGMVSKPCNYFLEKRVAESLAEL